MICKKLYKKKLIHIFNRMDKFIRPMMIDMKKIKKLADSQRDSVKPSTKDVYDWDKLPNTLPYAFDKQDTDGKLLFAVEDKELSKFIPKNYKKDKNLYYIISNEVPIVYFDIDKFIFKDFQNFNESLKKMVSLINEKCDSNIQFEDLSVFLTDTRDSCHIYIPKFKAKKSDIKNLVKFLNKQNIFQTINDKEPFDTSVYSRNQMLCCPNCCKKNRQNHKKYYIGDELNFYEFHPNNSDEAILMKYEDEIESEKIEVDNEVQIIQIPASSPIEDEYMNRELKTSRIENILIDYIYSLDEKFWTDTENSTWNLVAKSIASLHAQYTKKEIIDEIKKRFVNKSSKSQNKYTRSQIIDFLNKNRNLNFSQKWIEKTFRKYSSIRIRLDHGIDFDFIVNNTNTVNKEALTKLSQQKFVKDAWVINEELADYENDDDDDGEEKQTGLKRGDVMNCKTGFMYGNALYKKNGKNNITVKKCDNITNIFLPQYHKTDIKHSREHVEPECKRYEIEDNIESIFHNYFENKSSYNAVIRAGCGTGKSYHIVKAIVDECIHKNNSVIFITDNNSINAKIKSDLETLHNLTMDSDFTNHQYSNRNAPICNIVVSSIESLYRFVNKRFNTVIIDESVSFLEHFQSKHTFKKITPIECFQQVCEMIKSSKKSIYLDADNNVDTVKILKQIKPVSIYLNVNTKKYSEYSYKFELSETEWLGRLVSNLHNNKRVILATTSGVDFCKKVLKLLKNKFPTKSIAVFHVDGCMEDTDEDVNPDLIKQRKERIKQDFSEVEKYDCFVFSPSISNGISLNSERGFDKIMLHCKTTASISPRLALQMIFRDRNPIDKEIDIFIQPHQFSIHKEKINELFVEKYLTKNNLINEEDIRIDDENLQIFNQMTIQYDRDKNYFMWNFGECLYDILTVQNGIRFNGFRTYISHQIEATEYDGYKCIMKTKLYKNISKIPKKSEEDDDIVNEYIIDNINKYYETYENAVSQWENENDMFKDDSEQSYIKNNISNGRKKIDFIKFCIESFDFQNSTEAVDFIKTELTWINLFNIKNERRKKIRRLTEYLQSKNNYNEIKFDEEIAQIEQSDSAYKKITKQRLAFSSLMDLLTNDKRVFSDITDKKLRDIFVFHKSFILKIIKIVDYDFLKENLKSNEYIREPVIKCFNTILSFGFIHLVNQGRQCKDCKEPNQNRFSQIRLGTNINECKLFGYIGTGFEYKKISNLELFREKYGEVIDTIVNLNDDCFRKINQTRKYFVISKNRIKNLKSSILNDEIYNERFYKFNDKYFPYKEQNEFVETDEVVKNNEFCVKLNYIKSVVLDDDDDDDDSDVLLIDDDSDNDS